MWGYNLFDSLCCTVQVYDPFVDPHLVSMGAREKEREREILGEQIHWESEASLVPRLCAMLENTRTLKDVTDIAYNSSWTQITIPINIIRPNILKVRAYLIIFRSNVQIHVLPSIATASHSVHALHTQLPQSPRKTVDRQTHTRPTTALSHRHVNTRFFHK